ncbi:hypothetical protein ACI65C_002407 [Semiaphis heraclei]
MNSKEYIDALLSSVQLTEAELDFLNILSDAIQTASERTLYTATEQMGDPEDETTMHRQLAVEIRPALEWDINISNKQSLMHIRYPVSNIVKTEQILHLEFERDQLTNVIKNYIRLATSNRQLAVEIRQASEWNNNLSNKQSLMQIRYPVSKLVKTAQFSYLEYEQNQFPNVIKKYLGLAASNRQLAVEKIPALKWNINISNKQSLMHIRYPVSKIVKTEQILHLEYEQDQLPNVIKKYLGLTTPNRQLAVEIRPALEWNVNLPNKQSIMQIIYPFLKLVTTKQVSYLEFEQNQLSNVIKMYLGLAASNRQLAVEIRPALEWDINLSNKHSLMQITYPVSKLVTTEQMRYPEFEQDQFPNVIKKYLGLAATNRQLAVEKIPALKWNINISNKQSLMHIRFPVSKIVKTEQILHLEFERDQLTNVIKNYIRLATSNRQLAVEIRPALEWNVNLPYKQSIMQIIYPFSKLVTTKQVSSLEFEQNQLSNVIKMYLGLAASNRQLAVEIRPALEWDINLSNKHSLMQITYPVSKLVTTEQMRYLEFEQDQFPNVIKNYLGLAASNRQLAVEKIPALKWNINISNKQSLMHIRYPVSKIVKTEQILHLEFERDQLTNVIKNYIRLATSNRQLAVEIRPASEWNNNLSNKHSLMQIRYPVSKLVTTAQVSYPEYDQNQFPNVIKKYLGLAASNRQLAVEKIPALKWNINISNKPSLMQITYPVSKLVTTEQMRYLEFEQDQFPNVIKKYLGLAASNRQLAVEIRPALEWNVNLPNKQSIMQITYPFSKLVTTKQVSYLEFEQNQLSNVIKMYLGLAASNRQLAVEKIPALEWDINLSNKHSLMQITYPVSKLVTTEQMRYLEFEQDQFPNVIKNYLGLAASNRQLAVEKIPALKWNINISNKQSLMHIRYPVSKIVKTEQILHLEFERDQLTNVIKNYIRLATSNRQLAVEIRPASEWNNNLSNKHSLMQIRYPVSKLVTTAQVSYPEYDQNQFPNVIKKYLGLAASNRQLAVEKIPALKWNINISNKPSLMQITYPVSKLVTTEQMRYLEFEQDQFPNVIKKYLGLAASNRQLAVEIRPALEWNVNLPNKQSIMQITYPFSKLVTTKQVSYLEFEQNQLSNVIKMYLGLAASNRQLAVEIRPALEWDINLSNKHSLMQITYPVSKLVTTEQMRYLEFEQDQFPNVIKKYVGLAASNRQLAVEKIPALKWNINISNKQSLMHIRYPVSTIVKTEHILHLEFERDQLTNVIKNYIRLATSNRQLAVEIRPASEWNNNLSNKHSLMQIRYPVSKLVTTAQVSYPEYDQNQFPNVIKKYLGLAASNRQLAVEKIPALKWNINISNKPSLMQITYPVSKLVTTEQMRYLEFEQDQFPNVIKNYLGLAASNRQLAVEIRPALEWNVNLPNKQSIMQITYPFSKLVTTKQVSYLEFEQNQLSNVIKMYLGLAASNRQLAVEKIPALKWNTNISNKQSLLHIRYPVSNIVKTEQILHLEFERDQLTNVIKNYIRLATSNRQLAVEIRPALEWDINLSNKHSLMQITYPVSKLVTTEQMRYLEFEQDQFPNVIKKYVGLAASNRQLAVEKIPALKWNINISNKQSLMHIRYPVSTIVKTEHILHLEFERDQLTNVIKNYIRLATSNRQLAVEIRPASEWNNNLSNKHSLMQIRYPVSKLVTTAQVSYPEYDQNQFPNVIKKYLGLAASNRQLAVEKIPALKWNINISNKPSLMQITYPVSKLVTTEQMRYLEFEQDQFPNVIKKYLGLAASNRQLAVEIRPALEWNVNLPNKKSIMQITYPFSKLVTTKQVSYLEFEQNQLSNVIKMYLGLAASNRQLAVEKIPALKWNTNISNKQSLLHIRYPVSKVVKTEQILHLEFERDQLTNVINNYIRLATSNRQLAVEIRPALEWDINLSNKPSLMQITYPVSKLVTTEQMRYLEFEQDQFPNVIKKYVGLDASNRQLAVEIRPASEWNNNLSNKHSLMQIRYPVSKLVTTAQVSYPEYDQNQFPNVIKKYLGLAASNRQLAVEKIPALKWNINISNKPSLMQITYPVSKLVTTEQMRYLEFEQDQFPNVIKKYLGLAASNRQLAVEKIPALKWNINISNKQSLMHIRYPVSTIVKTEHILHLEFERDQLTNVIKNYIRLATSNRQLAVEIRPASEWNNNLSNKHSLMQIRYPVSKLVTTAQVSYPEYDQNQFPNVIKKYLGLAASNRQLAVEKIPALKWNINLSNKHSLAHIRYPFFKLVPTEQIRHLEFDKLELSNTLDIDLRVAPVIEKSSTPRPKHDMQLVAYRRHNLLESPKIVFSNLLKNALRVAAEIDKSLNFVLPLNVTQQKYNDEKYTSPQKFTTTEHKHIHHQQLIVENEPVVQRPSTPLRFIIVSSKTANTSHDWNMNTRQPLITEVFSSASIGIQEDIVLQSPSSVSVRRRSCLSSVWRRIVKVGRQLAVEIRPALEWNINLPNKQSIMQITYPFSKLVTTKQVSYLEFEQDQLPNVINKYLGLATSNRQLAVEKIPVLKWNINLSNKQSLMHIRYPFSKLVPTEQIHHLEFDKLELSNTLDIYLRVAPVIEKSFTLRPKHDMQLVAYRRHNLLESLKIVFSNLLKNALRVAADIDKSLNLVLPLNVTQQKYNDEKYTPPQKFTTTEHIHIHHQQLIVENEPVVQRPSTPLRFIIVSSKTANTSLDWNMNTRTQPVITEVFSSASIGIQEDIVLQSPSSTTEAHFKSNVDISSPIGFPQTSALSTIGQSSDLMTKLAVHKTMAFLTILSSNPKLLCIVPPFLIVDFLRQLSCNPALLNAIPQHLLAGFMTSLSSVPTIANAIPSNLFVQFNSALSIGTAADATRPAESARPEVLPTPSAITSVSAQESAAITSSSPTSGSASGLPGVAVTKEVTASLTPGAPAPGPASGLPSVAVTKEVTASLTPGAPAPGPASGLPGVAVTKEVTASLTPGAPAPGPASGLPGVAVTKEVTASLTPGAPSSGPSSGLPGVAVTKEVTASLTPGAPAPGPASGLPGVAISKEIAVSVTQNPLPPAAPVLPADLPTGDSYPPAAPSVPTVPAVPAVPAAPLAPTLPSVPCVNVPAVGSPILPALPIPSPSISPLTILTSLFNKGTGSQIDAKIDGIIKLFAGGNLKFPQLHTPEKSVTTKPVIHVKPGPDKVFILLPAPLLGKPEIPSTQATKLYYKPESLGQIISFVHERLFTPPKKLSLPKLNLPNLSQNYPVVPLPQAKPVKCLPSIFSKVPC